MAKRAFVTGGTSFFGQNLVEELLEQGWDVIALRRPQAEDRALSRYPQVTQVTGDLLDPKSLEAAIPRHVDCVFHAAGTTSFWSLAPLQGLRTSVRGTRNLVRAAVQARVKRFVHTSSVAAYGLHGGLITEDTPTRGSNSPLQFVRSKALAERQVRLGIAAGLPAVILNAGHVLGRYDRDHWARAIQFLQQRSMPFVAPGGGSFCDARAVARAHIAAAEHGAVAQNYLLGGAQATYLGFAQEASRILGQRSRFVTLPAGWLYGYAWLEERAAVLFRRPVEITTEAAILLSHNLYCSSRKAERELGYRPPSLEVILRSCCEWMLGEGLLRTRPPTYHEAVPRPPP